MGKRIYTLVFVLLLGLSAPAYAQMYEESNECMRTNSVEVYNYTSYVKPYSYYGQQRKTWNSGKYSSAYHALPQGYAQSNGLSSSLCPLDVRQRASRSGVGEYRSNIHRPFTDINGNSYGPKKVIIKPEDPDPDEDSPVGSPLALILFAAAAVLFRRKRE